MAAGKGKRMLPLTENFNKALLPLAYKAAISHIIEKFPKKIEIVVAIGHEKEKVSEYLLCAHSNRKIKLVEVDNISDVGSGPGYSLLRCEKYLKSPFIFFSVDTIIKEEIPLPNCNWMGAAITKKSEQFCTFSIKNNFIDRIEDKIKCKNRNAFIGLAGIKDYKIFFNSLKRNDLLINNERQVSNGFRALIQKKIHPIFFTWHDIGNLEGYNFVKKKFSCQKQLFNFEKIDEYLYFVENKVIKYYKDKNIVKKRSLRAKLLRGLCPQIQSQTNFFYSYKKINGNIIYNVKNTVVVEKLLEWLNKNLWKKKYLNEKEEKIFKKSCKLFYYEKTIKRIKLYHSKFNLRNPAGSINGQSIDTVEKLISKIDWNWLCDGTPAQFHGDLQFENILFLKDNRFTLLDWRQDFSEILEYGDLYYDLAKLNGGIYVSYKRVKEGLFAFKKNANDFTVSIQRDPFLNDSKKIFDNFVKQNNFDKRKIEILTGLIFLNMAAMHHEPFNHFIYHLGRFTLHKWINLE